MVWSCRYEGVHDVHIPLMCVQRALSLADLVVGEFGCVPVWMTEVVEGVAEFVCASYRPVVGRGSAEAVLLMVSSAVGWNSHSFGVSLSVTFI